MDKIELDYTLENLEKVLKLREASVSQVENRLDAARTAATLEARLSAYSEALRWALLRQVYVTWLVGFYAELERIMDEDENR